CFWRFLETMGIVPFLKNKKWDTVALRYNGPAYADNDYDTRLEASYARWKARSVGEDPDELEDIPLGRTPVQNAEPTSVWKTPEGVSTAVASGTGILATVKPESPDGRGPMDYALAIIIVVCVVVGAYY